MNTLFNNSFSANRRPAQSNRWRSLLGPLLLLTGGIAASAQTLSIDWARIAGGGGTSTGGVYAISGTAGQPDAGGPLTNGRFSVTGGFWVFPIAVQTVGAPLLTILPAAPGQVTISWTPASAGFVLQESLSLSPPSWLNSASGAANPATIPATLPNKYYRLRKP